MSETIKRPSLVSFRDAVGDVYTIFDDNTGALLLSADGEALLERKQVAELRDLLTRWLETGSLS